MKHTPGPWHVELAKGSYQRPALVMAGKKLVASCLGDQLSPNATSIGEAEANARLIAAAPTMKEALEEVDVGLQFYMERHGEYDNRLSALRNIIADVLAKAIAG